MAISVNIGNVFSIADLSIVVVVLPVCLGGIRLVLLTMSVVGILRMSIHMPLLIVIGVVN